MCWCCCCAGAAVLVVVAAEPAAGVLEEVVVVLALQFTCQYAFIVFVEPRSTADGLETRPFDQKLVGDDSRYLRFLRDCWKGWHEATELLPKLFRMAARHLDLFDVQKREEVGLEA